MPKPALVFLPGMMCDERLFAPQIEALDGAFQISVGNIGSHAAIADIARSVLETTPRRKFALCGLSMGGIVAMEMLRQQPERIERLVLMDTNHLPDTAERQGIRRRQMADVREGKLREVIIGEMKPNYLAAASRGNEDLLRLFIEMALDLGPDVFLNQSSALTDRAGASEALARWEGPALIVCGAEDQLCPPSRHHEMAALMANAQVSVIENAGHISTLEQPEAVNGLLERFLLAAGNSNP